MNQTDKEILELESINKKLSEIETGISDITGVHGTDLNDLKKELESIHSTAKDTNGDYIILLLIIISIILLIGLVHFW